MEEMQERKFNRLLRVLFTPPEKIEMSEQIANAIRNLKKAQDDLASVAAQYKSEMKKFEAEIASLAEKVNSGWEMRSIVCREIRDYNNGSVYVFRDDTEELIEERAMTVGERQQALPFKEGAVVDAGMPVSDSEHPTVAEAQADTQSEEGLTVPLTESVTIGHDELKDLPEDTNIFYVGKKESQDT